MPLYMDIHTVDSDTFSVEDVVKAHMEDLAIQEKFGVVQLKYWVNVEAKTLFCLMEGPNIQACNDVHKESHGNTACNIIEVSDDEFNLFLGIGKDLHDLAQTVTGEIDTGYRTILLSNIIDFTGKYEHYIHEVYRIVEKYQGVRMVESNNDVFASFIFASNAIRCALAIDKLLKSIPDKVEFSIALANGRPVDEVGEILFEETKKKVHCLCALGLVNTMYLTSETKILSAKETNSLKVRPVDFTIIQNDDFHFFYRLFQVLEHSFDRPDFHSNNLPASLGISKSQAYRKISSLTGMAPNQLLQEFRLRKSLALIKTKDKTIAEIAYDLGFNSPTYFTRAFKRRFNLLPTVFAKQQLGNM